MDDEKCLHFCSQFGRLLKMRINIRQKNLLILIKNYELCTETVSHQKNNETLTCNDYKSNSCVTAMKDIERRNIRTNIINMCKSLYLKVFFNQLSLHIKRIANIKDKI